MPDEILLVQALHHQDDGSFELVVQSRPMGGHPEIRLARAHRLRQRRGRAHRIVADDQVRVESEHRTSDGHRIAVPALGRSRHHLSIATALNSKGRKHRPVPRARDDRTEGSRVRLGQRIRV